LTTPVALERVSGFEKAREAQQEHLFHALKEYNFYMSTKEKALEGDSKDVLNLSIDGMEIVQLPSFATKCPKVSDSLPFESNSFAV
jgi:hypothetical protein